MVAEKMIGGIATGRGLKDEDGYRGGEGNIRMGIRGGNGRDGYIGGDRIMGMATGDRGIEVVTEEVDTLKFCCVLVDFPI